MNAQLNRKSINLGQAGATLIVSMVILLAMTMLGVVAMQSTNMQTKMAGNSTHTTNAFQAAESAIEQAFATGGFNADGTAYSTSYNTTFGGNTDAAVTIDLVKDNTFAPGTSPGMTTYYFEISATGQVTNTGAIAVNRQGVTIVAGGS
ncbi:MAG: hypothetical protein A2V90_03105 [Gammaproteobacteria bacterium RBG_16_57_12]|nr:MAG: hypothetical protein A2V90_03105 [Gammaproteobacteria bacterium RBG_16_57_12]